jgi:demethylmenaquinone methyltransferase/2-methoxy-6-polyprenyl-1,4-benzoquinol methylase
MGLFNWSAPLLKRYGDRWDDDGVAQIGGWLAPFVEKGGSLLDLGGGAGGLAVRLADTYEWCVTILDATPEMLAYVPPHGSVESHVGDAAEMPFEADRFDGVVVTDAFHHFRDQPAAVEEMRRVVRPGGGVVIMELDRAEIAIKLVAFLERIAREPGAFFTTDELCGFMSEHGIDGECTRLAGASYVFVGTVREESRSDP